MTVAGTVTTKLLMNACAHVDAGGVLAEDLRRSSGCVHWVEKGLTIAVHQPELSCVVPGAGTS